MQVYDNVLEQDSMLNHVPSVYAIRPRPSLSMSTKACELHKPSTGSCHSVPHALYRRLCVEKGASVSGAVVHGTCSLNAIYDSKKSCIMKRALAAWVTHLSVVHDRTGYALLKVTCTCCPDRRCS